MNNSITGYGPALPPAAFYDLPGQIYPEIQAKNRENQALICSHFNPGSAFFEQGGATAFYVQEGEVRLGGFLHPNTTIDAQKTAFFGYWETKNNPEANWQAFAWLENWAREQGATQLLGPINFSTLFRYRLLTQPTDTEPFWGEPYNPDFYPKIMEKTGFQVRYRYYSQIADKNLMQEIRAQSNQRLRNVSLPYRLVPFDPGYWQQYEQSLFELISSAFAQNYAFTGLDFDTYARQLVPAFAAQMHPDFSVFVLDGDRPVAFFLCFPDYQPLLRQGVAAGAISFAQHYPQLAQPSLVFKTAAVHPEYRHAGLFNVMAAWSLRHYGTGPEEQVIAALIREDNPSRLFADRFAVDHRHYALYHKLL